MEQRDRPLNPVNQASGKAAPVEQSSSLQPTHFLERMGCWVLPGSDTFSGWTMSSLSLKGGGVAHHNDGFCSQIKRCLEISNASQRSRKALCWPRCLKDWLEFSVVRIVIDIHRVIYWLACNLFLEVFCCLANFIRTQHFHSLLN